MSKTSRSRLVLPVFFLAMNMAVESSAIGIRVPLSYRSWNVNETPVEATTTQWVAPIHLSIPMSRRVDMVVQTGVQSGTIDQGESIDLTGATDTQVGLVVRLAEDRLVVQGVASVPTGTTSLDTLEQKVAIALAPPFLGYRVREAGMGRDLGIGASYAFPLTSGWAVGLGAGYLHRGTYTPLEGGLEIQPGAETRFSLGLDGQLWGVQVQLDGTRRLYGADEGEGIDYEEPPAWQGSLGLSAQNESWGFGSVGLWSDKEEGEPSISPYSGRYLAGSLTLRRAVGESTWLGATGELIQFSGQEDELGATFESLTGGVGPLLVLPMRSSLSIEGRFLYLFGDLDGEAIDGFDVQLLLAFKTGSPDS